MASLRENYHAKVAQMEVLLQSLGNARSDSSFLHRESELVVTNINQWVKEQKQGNEKLNFKIKDQSKKIIHLTAERDHLQESVEGLQEEMRLKAELEESRIEAERFRTCGQTSHPAAPHRICSDCDRSLEWSGRQPVDEESSGCQPASALAPDSACAGLAGRGATFAAEVARRVALRTLERRPLPCGHHRWSRPALSAGTGHALHISGRDTDGC
ncbi:polyamine-modulated factor 1-binding protein 1 [Salmo trutta]|uniref:polyamine-modulated factor 1-binding protein 1 n=1 Tax=Salmo trutta TaxID=8032 RepID=UPI00112FE054|nr:polyamine-modulated factor 1-binding protein 1-like [Salmo trutta]